MPRPIPADRVAAIQAEVQKYPDGATFLDVATALSPVPRVRNLQRWLSALVRKNRLIRVGNTKAVRYKLPFSTASTPAGFASPAGEAIHRLVTQPIQERTPTDYRRVMLASYQPNETCYIPAELRARIVARRDAGAWRQTPAFDGLLTALASRILALENATDAAKPYANATSSRRFVTTMASPALALTDADIASWLKQPERPGARWEAQLLWNIRSGFVDLTNRSPAAGVTVELLSELYQRLTAKLLGPAATLTPTAQPALSFLRRSVLELSDTVYHPPADPWRIREALETVLRVSSQITDPVERSFFLLTHLLYLLPFGTLNAAMALLVMKVPLLAAGLPPITFAAVTPGDLLAGIRGVWELGRIELLRDAFACGK